MDFQFHEGALPPGYGWAYEPSLFNREGHRMLQAPSDWLSFYILSSGEPLIEVHGAIHVHRKDDLGESPYQAPFGSFEGSEHVFATVWFEFISYVEARLLAQGVRRVVFRASPACYREELVPQLEVYLLNQGYSICRAEVSSVIPVSEMKPDDFFHRSERRKLEKAKNEGFRFEQLSLLFLEHAYRFIARCRSEKNYSLSMSLESLQQTVARFPDHFYIFGVFAQNELAAAAITIRPSAHVLYDFYHDHDARFDYFSPVVLLVDHMYSFCFHNNIRWLDLGTSSVDGKPNFPLLHFKSLLGGKPFPKLTFEKILQR